MMTYKEWMDQVNKSNDTFKRASKAKRRCMVARDVIRALNTKLFEANNHGGYVDNLHVYGNDWDKDLREVLINKNPNCNVCGKGSILLCTVMRQDNLKAGEGTSIGFFQTGERMSNGLKGLFSQDQLDLIEGHYEVGGNSHVRFVLPNSPFKKYDGGEERMIAIMKNIIRNKGEFKPETEV